MTNQTQITPDELAAKWSNLLNQAFIQIITMEKQLASGAALIQEMTTREIALEDELAKLKMLPRPLSEAEREIAAQGSAIIADGKEKAAP